MNAAIRVSHEAVGFLGQWWVLHDVGHDGVRGRTVRILPEGVVEVVRGRDISVGHWTLQEAPTPSLRVDRVRLTDGAEQTALLTLADSGPDDVATLRWSESSTRLNLVRSPRVHAPMAGVWRADPRERPAILRGDYVLDVLELGTDGQYTQRFGGGVVRSGRWGAVRDESQESTRTIECVLWLEPDETVFELERWPAEFTFDTPVQSWVTLHGVSGQTRTRLCRTVAVATELALLGRWIRTEGDDETLPLQLGLEPYDKLWMRSRRGEELLSGRWTTEREPSPDPVLRGELAIDVERRGYPNRSQVWLYELDDSHAKGALLLRSTHGAWARFARLSRT